VAVAAGQQLHCDYEDQVWQIVSVLRTVTQPGVVQQHPTPVGLKAMAAGTLSSRCTAGEGCDACGAAQQACEAVHLTRQRPCWWQLTGNGCKHQRQQLLS
jgi:hypothetical protein